MPEKEPLQRWDYLWVGLYTLALYAIVLAVGGPLTLHEGVLSQTTKAMLANHDWLVPRYGDAPWLERPPLPQWIACAICTLIGHCDAEWNVRIGPALAGLVTVLLATWLAGRLFGRGVGLLSGLALATMYNFVRYSTLAEADIVLAPIVAGVLACYALLEVEDGSGPATDANTTPVPESQNFFAGRPWPVLGFFVLLGMTNLVKGLVFGMVIALAPIAAYQLWNHRGSSLAIFLGFFAWAVLAKLAGWRSAFGLAPLALFMLGNIGLFTRYLWLWGWLAFAAVALPW
ncbi:MAG: glycosyltransferase family 39 protein, partial [Planctomycetes bacterium]|nr:glycosyltransferase family 39 protein [Planctomycetota bacterium]